MNAPSQNPASQHAPLPAHIEQTVHAISQLHADHANRATRLDRFVACLTSHLARPVFAAWLTVMVFIWIGGNLLARSLGYAIVDPPPFNWLQGAASVMALYVTLLILTTQRRDDQLASHRERLTLELAVITDQKVAKIIDLLEEMRRDDAGLRDRHDPEAESMAMKSDPKSVLSAIKDTHDDISATGSESSLSNAIKGTV